MDREISRTEEDLGVCLDHQTFINEIAHKYSAQLTGPTIIKQKTQKTKFFLTEEQNTDVVKEEEITLPMSAKDMKRILRMIEEDNLFLINNIQEEELGAEKERRQEQNAPGGNIEAYRNKVRAITENNDRLKEKVELARTENTRLKKQVTELYTVERKEEEKGSFSDEVEKLRRAIQRCYKGLIGGDQAGDMSATEKMTRIEILMHEEIQKVKKLTKRSSNDQIQALHQFIKKLHNQRKDE